MASTLQCSDVSGKVDCFLPARDKDSHVLCINCCGKNYTADDRCTDCHNWTDEKWGKGYCLLRKVSYSAGEGEGEEGCLPLFLLFSGFSTLSVMPMFLLNITPDSFDNAVTMMDGTSDVCTTTSVVTLLVNGET